MFRRLAPIKFTCYYEDKLRKLILLNKTQIYYQAWDLIIVIMKIWQKQSLSHLILELLGPSGDYTSLTGI